MTEQKGRWFFAVSIFLLLQYSGPADSAAQTEQHVATLFKPAAIKEELLSSIPPGTKHLRISQDGNLVVWQVKKNKNWVMVVNNVPGPEFDADARFAFSPDCRHYAYAARRGSSWLVILDGKEYGEAFERGVVDGLTFSADSQHLAYFGFRGKQHWLVIDGREQGLQYISDPVISPDGGHWACWTRAGLVMDGKQMDYKNIGYAWLGTQPVFSADGQHLAYGATINKGKPFMVIDGTEHQKYDYIGPPVFSPDGQHLAYIATDSKLWSTKSTVIFDGKPGPVLPKIVLGPIFSQDSRHIAYLGIQNEGIRTYLIQVTDEQVTYPIREGKIEARECRGLSFSPDGQHLAYVVLGPDKAFLILDGQQHGPAHEEIGQPAFSLGGKLLAYTIVRANKVFMIVNGSEGKGYDSVWTNTRSFSADEKQVTYIAQEGNKLFRVIQSGD